MKRETYLVRLVLLDADVIIRLFELGLWDKVVAGTRVTIAKTVLEQAAHYFDTETTARKHIDLQPAITKGLIDIIDCDATEVAPVRSACRGFADLHTGELESLAIMSRPGCDAHLCVADGGAIRASVMLGIVERVVSLEELLRQLNLQRSFSDRDLYQFSEARFRQMVKKAEIDKVQGLGR